MQDKGLPKIIPIAISCSEFEGLVSDYIDGELAGDTRSICEVHLGHCVQCQDLVRDLESILKVAKTLRQSPIPEGVRYRLRAALRHALGLKLEEPSNNG